MFQVIEYNEYAGRSRRAVELERRLTVARQLNETRGRQSIQWARLWARIVERVLAMRQSARRRADAPA